MPEMKTCLSCGNVFKTQRAWVRLFCSRECSAAARKGKSKQQWFEWLRDQRFLVTRGQESDG